MAHKFDFNRSVYLTGTIDEESVAPIIDFINAVNDYDYQMTKTLLEYEAQPIILHISSGGGSFHDGMALINIIRLSKTPVVTIIVGESCSMALAIGNSGHMRYATEDVMFMFHTVSNFFGGNIEAHKNNMFLLNKIQATYEKILMKGSKLTEQKIKQMKSRNKDYWFDENEALELGIIDDIITFEEVKELQK